LQLLDLQAVMNLQIAFLPKVQGKTPVEVTLNGKSPIVNDL
jgi:hypothetical protein